MEPNEVIENETTEVVNTEEVANERNQQIAQQQVEQKAEESEPEEPQILPDDKDAEKEQDKKPPEKGKKEITKHLVESSNLEWVGYDEQKRDLYIGFKNKTVYRYYNVPQDIFDGLLKAGSKGRYFWMKIRRQPFEYKRVK